MNGNIHSVLVALKGVILWTPVPIDKVSIAIVDTPIGRIRTAIFIPWHVDPIHGGIAMTAYVADINIIGPDMVS